MSFDAERLYNLLPAIYRVRDDEQGGPLKELLAVIAEQVAVVEEDLEQLYDDQFIETCAEWVVPYIGDLIGYRLLHSVAPKVVSARAEVAHTMAFRRRKGTAAVLEQLARDVSGWPARVVEFFLLLGWTQYMNHVRPDHSYAPDLRDWERMEQLNTPFDRVAHTVDVRHIARGEGGYNIPNVGIFLWRLADYPATDSPAFRRDDQRWHFHPLGLDTPLFTRAESEDEITHLAGPLNVPQPISRRVLHEQLAAYYGANKSIFLRVDGTDIEAAAVESCDLSDVGAAWAHEPDTKIAIDPVLGRIAFPAADSPGEVVVRFRYGFSADMGGGEYERETTFEPQLEPVDGVVVPASLQDALDGRSDGGVVQIGDNGRYGEELGIAVAAEQRLELRAANNRRPTLLRGGDAPSSGDWLIEGGADATVTLNGLLIQGHTLRVPAAPDNQLARLRLRHCTLVPGAGPSVIVASANVTVEIDHCILGGLRVAQGSHVVITDSILDATAETAVAYAAPDDTAGGPLHVERCTLMGRVHTHFLELASNSIFLAAGDATTPPVRSDRRQRGCVRFSHVPLAAVVPRRFNCQPKTEADALRVRPRFTSLRYGDPGYFQLSPRCAAEIRWGADDEAEMGAFHDLYQPQRETNVRVRLEEYLRFRLEAGIFYVT
jgi:hypothetical protein